MISLTYRIDQNFNPLLHAYFLNLKIYFVNICVQKKI